MNTLGGWSVLVVEDIPIIAMEIEGCLTDAGAHVHVVHSLSHALGLIDQNWSAAVVDYRLGDDTASGLCAALAEHEVPFVIVTGECDEDLRGYDAPILLKPASPERLVAVLHSISKASEMIIDGRYMKDATQRERLN